MSDGSVVDHVLVPLGKVLIPITKSLEMTYGVGPYVSYVKAYTCFLIRIEVQLRLISQVKQTSKQSNIYKIVKLGHYCTTLFCGGMRD